MNSLNPYSIGIWSATHTSASHAEQCHWGLNPYSIGIWSATLSGASQTRCYKGTVLILILLEYGLRQHVDKIQVKKSPRVLILILLEYGLRRERAFRPTCREIVLILILLEYGLRPHGLK